MAVWLQVKVRHRGLGLRPRLYADSVCESMKAAPLSRHVRQMLRYINDPYFFYLLYTCK